MERKLYSIQEKSAAERVLKNGLVVPTILCEDKSLAQHLVNVGLEDPTILEIDTEGLPNVFQKAAHDEDELKPYMNDYVDYFTFSPIPADHITKAKLTSTNELGARVYSGMLSMKENVTSVADMEEVAAGMKKMVNLGIASEEHIKAEVQTAMALAREGRFSELKDEEDYEYSEEGSFRRPTPEEIANGMPMPDFEPEMGKEEYESTFRRPTPEEIANGMPMPEMPEDDFTKAVEGISTQEEGIEK